jgi:hypothetical protein
MSATSEARSEASKRADEIIKSLSEGKQAPAEKPEQQETQSDTQETKLVAPDSAGVEHDWGKRLDGERRKRLQAEQAFKEADTAARQMSERLKRLEEDLEKERHARESMQPAFAGVLSEDEVDQIGQENLAIISKLAEEKANSKISRYEKRFAEMEERLAYYENRERSKEFQERDTSLRSKLSALAPGWEQVDKDTGFADWMRDVDQDSGRPRLDLFAAAKQNNDVRRMAEFYQEYASQKAEVAQADPRLSRVAPQSKPQQAAPSEQRRYTARDYQNLMNDLARGSIAPQQMERARAVQREMEAQLFPGGYR